MIRRNICQNDARHMQQHERSCRSFVSHTSMKMNAGGGGIFFVPNDSSPNGTESLLSGRLNRDTKNREVVRN